MTEATSPDRDWKMPKPRLFGLGVFALGVILLAIFAGWPAYCIKRGDPQVTYSIKFAGIGLFLAVWGLAGMIFGGIAIEWIKRIDGNMKLQDIKAVHWVAIVSYFAVCIFALTKLEAYLESLGYQRTY